jgi:secreted Zn-dependent insulinase-like peptidase
MSFKVVTSIISSDEVLKRINDFLSHYRSELVNMNHETYMEHLIGLAMNKLEMFDSLEDECGWYWSEITEGRYDFETHREEVHCLRSITKEVLIDAYDRWFMPVSDEGKQRKRRGLVFQVIGSGEGEVSSGRPPIDPTVSLGVQVDNLIAQFHSNTKDSWGRISFGSQLKRANTD